VDKFEQSAYSTPQTLQSQLLLTYPSNPTWAQSKKHGELNDFF
jgi:hypothetical protein